LKEGMGSSRKIGLCFDFQKEGQNFDGSLSRRA